jgi:hypothetical protein
MKKQELKNFIKEVVKHVLKETDIDWDAWSREKYGQEGKDWVSVDMGNGIRSMARIAPTPNKEKTKIFTTGFGGDPNKSHGRSNEPRTF